MEIGLPSEGIEVRETTDGDFVVTHKGKSYPVKRDTLASNEVLYLGYMAVMHNIKVVNGESLVGSQKAYIYHNAEDANELCLNVRKKEPLR
jgi:hypothetical protein